MIRGLAQIAVFAALAVGLVAGPLAGPAAAQETIEITPLPESEGESQSEAPPARPTSEASEASGGVIRVLDKISGVVTDLELRSGTVGQVGSLSVTLRECRYPTSNPSGDAYVLLDMHYREAAEPIFRGWMIASNPAVNALDHPRYDVWALRCNS